MQQENLNVDLGTTGTIALESEDGFEDHHTRVEGVDGMVLTLALPTKDNVTLEPVVGEIVSFTINDPRLGQRFFDGEALGTTKVPVPMGSFRVLAVGRDQKRQHFRLSLEMRPASCLIWESSTEVGRASWRPVAGLIKDLSAGGLGLNCEEQLEQGARLRIRFPLPASVSLFAIDGLVRVSLAPTGGFFAGLEFDEIAPEQRERIAKHIHMHQLEARRAGRMPVAT